mgnify:CR=1 FL=1
MASIPDGVRAVLEAPSFWALATLNADGSPQNNVMWVDVEGDKVMLNTSIGRVKEKNMRRDGRLSLSYANPQNPYERIEIRGKAVEFKGGDEGIAGINKLANKYLGSDYPWLQPGEERVTILIEPTRVIHETP